MVINIVLGHQKEEAIAAVAVFRTIEGLVIGFFAGFSSAASVLVGKDVGAGETKNAYNTAIRIVYLCQSTIVLVVVMLFTFHSPLLHLMYFMVLTCLLLANNVFKLPFFVVFAICYIDEPIRFVLLQIHMYSGKWIKPVTPEGRLGLEKFMQERKSAKIQ